MARLALSLALSTWIQGAFGLNFKAGEPPFRQVLDNYADLQYYGNITVGNQQLHAVLDTGSIEFVVISDRCNRCGTTELYHFRTSKSYKAGQAESVLSYGSGTLDVAVAYDQVTAGHLSTVGVPFWEVNGADMPLLTSSDFQAIVGLGPIPEGTTMLDPSSEGTEGAAAVLLMKFGIDKFGVCLGREPGSSGYFTWNDDSMERSASHFTTLKVPETGYWMLSLTDVSIGNTVIDCKSGCGAVVDTGTSLLAMPQISQLRMERALAKLKGSCADLTTWPDFRFKLNGKPFSLPADSYIGDVEGDVSEDMIGHFKPKRSRKSKAAQSSMYSAKAGEKEDTSKECDISVMNVAMDSDLGAIWILGAPFFRKYYTMFHQSFTSPTVSFAVASDECKPTTSSGMLVKVTERALPRRIHAGSVRISPWVKRFNDSLIMTNTTRKLQRRAR